MGILKFPQKLHTSLYVYKALETTVQSWTFEQNKHFLLASFRDFKKNVFCREPDPPLPLFTVEIRSLDTVTWLQY